MEFLVPESSLGLDTEVTCHMDVPYWPYNFALWERQFATKFHFCKSKRLALLEQTKGCLGRTEAICFQSVFEELRRWAQGDGLFPMPDIQRYVGSEHGDSILLSLRELSTNVPDPLSKAV